MVHRVQVFDNIYRRPIFKRNYYKMITIDVTYEFKLNMNTLILIPQNNVTFINETPFRCI